MQIINLDRATMWCIGRWCNESKYSKKTISIDVCVCVCVSSSRVTSFSFRSFRKEIKKENFSRESYFESYPIIIHIVFYGVCSTHHDTNEVVKLSETWSRRTTYRTSLLSLLNGTIIDRQRISELCKLDARIICVRYHPHLEHLEYVSRNVIIQDRSQFSRID